MLSKLGNILRKSTLQWFDQIRLYHSTMQQSPCIALMWYVQTMLLLLLCFLNNRNNLMNSCASISHRNKERFPWEDILEEKLSRNRSGHRKWTCGFHPVLLSHFPSFSLRPLRQSRSRIGVQPCLRSLHWALNKGDCGSAGCPPTEAGTLASLTLLLKVWVWSYLWAVLTCVYKGYILSHLLVNYLMFLHSAPSANYSSKAARKKE